MALVTVNGEQVEVSLSDIVLDDNQIIIDKNNPPSDLLTKKAHNAILQDRLEKRDKNIVSDLLEKKEIHEQVFAKYNISLDDDGKPKGLKPDFDPQEWIQKKSVELTKPIKDELENFKTRYERAKRARIEDAILAATKGQFKDEFTTSKDEGRVKPIVVNQFRDLFDENENGQIVLKDADGNWAIDNDGMPVTPGKYLSNAEKFGDWMVDKRQKGTGFQNGAAGGKKFYTRDQIDNMSSKEFAENQSDILVAAKEGRISE